MKRILSLIIAILLVMSMLASCQSEEETTTADQGGTGTPDESSTPDGDDSSTPGEDSSNTPGEDSSNTPGGEDSSNTPGGEDSSNTPGGEDSSNTPGGEDSSNTPGGEDSSNTPGGEDSSNTPGGEDSSNTPGGEDSSNTPGGEDSSNTPGGDDTDTPGGGNDTDDDEVFNPDEDGGEGDGDGEGGGNEGDGTPSNDSILNEEYNNLDGMELKNPDRATWDGMSIQDGADYGKEGDNVFVVDATTATIEAMFHTLPAGKTGYNTGLNTLVIQADYYVPSGTNVQIDAIALQWTSDRTRAGECTGANMHLYRITADGNELYLPRKANNGVPVAAEVHVDYPVYIKFDEWFTITVVIDTETGVAKLYWTHDVDGTSVTTHIYTYNLFASNLDHAEFDLTEITFSKVNNWDKRSGPFVVDNARIYTDETQRPGYGGNATPDEGEGGGNEGGGAEDTEPNYEISTDFSSTDNLAGYMDGENVIAGITVSADGTAYGKPADDKVFAVNATTTSGRVYIQIPGAYVNLLDGTQNKYVGASSGNTYVILQADYYFAQGTVATIFGGAKNIKSLWQGAAYDKANVNLYQIKADGTSVALVKGGDCSGGIPPTATTVMHQTALPVGEWFTLSTVVNTETGWVKMYVNGVLYVEYQFTWGGNVSSPITPTNIDFYSFTFSMQNKSNGSGSYAVDNAKIYTDLSKLEISDATPDEGEGGGNEGGETTDPEGGETTDPEGGETPDPEGGETTDPEGGETTNPEGGETTDPEGGETTDPEGGETTDPEGGETTDPEGGETTGGEV